MSELFEIIKTICVFYVGFMVVHRLEARHLGESVDECPACGQKMRAKRKDHRNV